MVSMHMCFKSLGEFLRMCSLNMLTLFPHFTVDGAVHMMHETCRCVHICHLLITASHYCRQRKIWNFGWSIEHSIYCCLCWWKTTRVFNLCSALDLFMCFFVTFKIRRDICSPFVLNLQFCALWSTSVLLGYCTLFGSEGIIIGLFSVLRCLYLQNCSI